MRKNKHRGKNKKRYIEKSTAQIVSEVEATFNDKRLKELAEEAGAFIHGKNKYGIPDKTPQAAIRHITMEEKQNPPAGTGGTKGEIFTYEQYTKI